MSYTAYALVYSLTTEVFTYLLENNPTDQSMINSGLPTHFLIKTKQTQRIHFIVLGWVEETEVQFPLVSQGFPNRGDLLLHHIQRSVHCVVKLQLVLSRHAADVQRVVLRKDTDRRV